MPYSNLVDPFLRNGVLPPGSRHTVISDLQTAAAAAVAMERNPKRPPEVEKSESSLPRHWRSTMSQLRSGFCCCLRSYEAVVEQSGSSLCPKCNAEEYSVHPLFQCGAKPTTLYKIDLWINPLHVAFFLLLFSQSPD